MCVLQITIAHKIVRLLGTRLILLSILILFLINLKYY